MLLIVVAVIDVRPLSLSRELLSRRILLQSLLGLLLLYTRLLVLLSESVH